MKILVTAGPTREPIDPVRFISNYSTGHMGYSLARCAKRRGHEIVLVSGQAGLTPPRGIKVVYVETAAEMLHEVKKNLSWCDCLIMAAAVSDYRPKIYSASKIKKNKNKALLRLVKNPDILISARSAFRDKIIVGFCLETEDLVKNAIRKLRSKGLDIVIANKVDEKHNPFGKGKTEVTIIDRNGRLDKIKNVDKAKISKILLDKIERYDIL